MNPARCRTRPRGFTLVEMLVVLALVGVLAAGARPLLELQHRRAQEFALRDALRQIRTALDTHKREADAGRIVLPDGHSGWPASLDALVLGVPVAASGVPASPPARLYLLRRLPRDPFADPALPARDTWALRASTSPPQAPQPGDDVFDVASRSERQALDGSHYRDW